MILLRTTPVWLLREQSAVTLLVALGMLAVIVIRFMAWGAWPGTKLQAVSTWTGSFRVARLSEWNSAERISGAARTTALTTSCSRRLQPSMTWRTLALPGELSTLFEWHEPELD